MRRRVEGRLGQVLLAAWLALAPGAARAGLEAEEIELEVAVHSWQAEMEETLAEWVGMNTGSRNLAGLERFATMLPGELERMGFEVEARQGAMLDVPGLGPRRTGPIVVGRRAALRAGAPRFLLVGHYDTVFEPSSEFQELKRDEAARGRASGPGAVDMKGGLLVMLYALRALHEADELGSAHWTVLLNGDEELGSLGSRPLIEAEAREATYGFVFESARPDGAMVRSRRGLGQFHLQVTGVGAHAGSAHAKGRSAIRALAEKILAIEALTDYERGITLNVGTVSGGIKRNVVPERAEAWIDLRYDAVEAGEAIRAELERIRDESGVEGTTAQLWGTLHRPPKPETEAVRALLGLHREAARDLGIELGEPVHSGGGTDGSLMGAAGLATLDTMGVVGGAAHTTREYVELGSLSERAALAALLFRRLARGSEPTVE